MAERVKLYRVLLPVSDIQTADDPLGKTIEMMFAALKEFFVLHFKKVKPEYIDSLWEKVDLTYLRSLPYPAPDDQQRYFGDDLV